MAKNPGAEIGDISLMIELKIKLRPCSGSVRKGESAEKSAVAFAASSTMATAVSLSARNERR